MTRGSHFCATCSVLALLTATPAQAQTRGYFSTEAIEQRFMEEQLWARESRDRQLREEIQRNPDRPIGAYRLDPPTLYGSPWVPPLYIDPDYRR